MIGILLKEAFKTVIRFQLLIFYQLIKFSNNVVFLIQNGPIQMFYHSNNIEVKLVLLANFMSGWIFN